MLGASKTLDLLSKSLEVKTCNSRSSRETSKANNSIWMLRPRLSSQLLTKTSLGILKIQEHQITCKSGRPTEDGSKCSNMLEIDSKMKEECSSELKTKRTLLLPRTFNTDGM